MTMSQKLITTIKPLSLCLTTILFTSLLAINTAHAQNATGSSNVISSSPSTSTTTPDSTTGVVAPAPATTTTVTTPATATTTANTIKPAPLAVSAKDPSTVSMDQPNLTDNDVLNWATQAAQWAYTYDFKNYPKQIPMLQESFTPEGWKAFSAALNKSNNLSVVQNRKLVASATPTGKAVLLKEGPINGVYTWRIQIPMTAAYESESRLIKQNLMVTMLVTRAKNAKGVGISHFIAVVAPANQPSANTNLTANGMIGPSGGSSSQPGTGAGTSSTNVPGPITTPPPGSPSDLSGTTNSRSQGSTPGMNMPPVTPQGTPNTGYGTPSTVTPSQSQ